MVSKKKTPATDPVVDLKAELVTQQKKEMKMSEKNSSGILELDMNLEDYEDFEPLPDAAYPGTITGAEMRTSDKNNDYYYVTFQVHPDDYPADYSIDNAPEGINLVYARVQKPDARNRRSITGVKNFLRAIGIPLKTSTINPGDWEGRKAKLILGHQDWNGQDINTIKAVEAID